MNALMERVIVSCPDGRPLTLPWSMLYLNSYKHFAFTLWTQLRHLTASSKSDTRGCPHSDLDSVTQGGHHSDTVDVRWAGVNQKRSPLEDRVL